MVSRLCLFLHNLPWHPLEFLVVSLRQGCPPFDADQVVSLQLSQLNLQTVKKEEEAPIHQLIRCKTKVELFNQSIFIWKVS